MPLQLAVGLQIVRRAVRHGVWLPLACCILGVVVTHLLTTRLVRPTPRHLRYVRIDPAETATRAQAEALDFRRRASADGLVSGTTDSEQSAQEAVVNAHVLPDWLPRSRNVEAVFEGSGAPTVLTSSEWAAPNLEPPATSDLPEAEIAKLRRRHGVHLSLYAEKLATLEGVSEPPWQDERYQLLSTAGVSPSALSVGRDYAPCASPELTLAWYEADLGVRAAPQVRELAIQALKTASVRRRELVVQILKALRARAASSPAGRAASEPRVFYLADGVLHVFPMGECAEIDDVLTQIEERREAVSAQLRSLSD